MEHTEITGVKINLNTCMNSRAFDDTEIIHKAEFEKAKQLIDTKLDSINDENHNNNNIRKRYNDTITILGSRGSGKTSFLMSVLSHYENHTQIEIIELIDPTLIEEKGHIFLTLVSLIRDKVENVISRNECNPYSKGQQQRNCWEQKLKKLAAGLPSIDIDNSSIYSNWHDPEHVMKKGLEAVKAAKELEQNFEEIVKIALKILDKKAFLIAFDDIDVNVNNGWKVLETIRKYLTSQYIITLLSGDIKLFSKAIRKHQWENFGKELLKNEGERMGNIDKYDELVTEIEGQYMQKIMKAPNRIHLLTIGERINENQTIQITHINKRYTETLESKEDYISTPIYKHYTEHLKSWGLNNKYEIHAVNTYLLGLPLRTQIQILKLLEDVDLNMLNITDAFVSDMYESGVDVELAKSQPKDFCYIAHKFLLQKEIINETYQLLPTSGSPNCNAVLFSLFSMFMAHSKNNPSMLFEYWITIATIKNLLTIMPYNSEMVKDVAGVPTIEGAADYSFIGQNKVYRDICSYLSTYIRATLNIKSENKNPWGGTLILKGFAEKANSSINQTQDRIDAVFKNESVMRRQLAFFPISTATFAHKQQSIVIYSFYTLLGTIVELLKRYNVIRRDNKQERIDDSTIYDIHVLLKELSQIKDNVMPDFDRMSDIGDFDSANHDWVEEPNTNNTDLATVLCIWMSNYPKCVPPHLIGKTATRAFYAMRNLDDKILSESEHNLGDSIHRRLIIVFNSAIIEDAKENLKNYTLSNNNPSVVDKIFIDNLSKISSLSDDEIRKLEFSRWILTCPLFLLYLNTDNYSTTNNIDNSEKSNSIWEYLNYYIDKMYNNTDDNKRFSSDWFKTKSIYNQLKHVSIIANKRRIMENEKFNFLITKRGIKKTIIRIKPLYDTPDALFSESNENIYKKIIDYVKNKNVLMDNITKLKEYCELCPTWDEVIYMVQKIN